MNVRRDDNAAPTAVSPRTQDGSALWQWLLAAPGLGILACGAISLTPLIVVFGCRLGGFLQVYCASDIVKPGMDAVFTVALLSLVYWEAAAPVVALAIGIVGWRLWQRWRAR